MRQSFLYIFLAIWFMVPSSLYADDLDKLERCEPYEQLIKNELYNSQLPIEFYYLAVAESGCKPKVVSNKGAVGIYQLMPATARRFGVQDSTDVVSNVNGAIKYLSSLYVRFNDVFATIVAYNAGGTNLIKKCGKDPSRDCMKDNFREGYNLALTVLGLYRLDMCMFDCLTNIHLPREECQSRC